MRTTQLWSIRSKQYDAIVRWDVAYYPDWSTVMDTLGAGDHCIIYAPHPDDWYTNDHQQNVLRLMLHAPPGTIRWIAESANGDVYPSPVAFDIEGKTY